MTHHNTKPPANNLRAWRTYRHMTQHGLGAAVGTTGGMISLLETGVRGLSKRWLERFAPILDTTPGAILDFKPEDVEWEIVRAAMRVPAERRADVTAFLKWLSGETVHLAAVIE